MSELSKEAIEQMDEAALREALVARLETPTFQDLRKQVNESSKAIKEAKELGAREASLNFTLQQLGVEKVNPRIRELIESDLADKPINQETVSAAFEEYGLPVGSRDPAPPANESVQDPEPPKPQESPVAKEMGEVASLSAKVNAATKGNVSIEDKIRSARSQDDLIEAAREGGFLAGGYEVRPS